MNTKLRAGDPVKISSGKHKGMTGKIVRFIEKKKRGTNVMNTYVFVSDINVVKRAQKGKGFVDVHLPIHISNVGYYDATSQNTIKIGIVKTDGKKTRVNKKTSLVIS